MPPEAPPATPPPAEIWRPLNEKEEHALTPTEFLGEVIIGHKYMVGFEVEELDEAGEREQMRLAFEKVLAEREEQGVGCPVQ